MSDAGQASLSGLKSVNIGNLGKSVLNYAQPSETCLKELPDAEMVESRNTQKGVFREWDRFVLEINGLLVWTCGRYKHFKLISGREIRFFI